MKHRRRRPRPRFQGVCAICDNTNTTTQICDDCRNDPINEGWSETWEDVDELVGERAADGAGSLAELSDRKLREPTQLRASILDLATRGLYCSYQYFDRRGHSRGRRWGYLALTYRDIAFLLNCDHTHVLRIVRGQFR